MLDPQGARAGPQARAQWRQVLTASPTEGARPVPLMSLPGVDDAGQPVHYVLRGRPAVRAGTGGEPRFSLTLTLSRRPTSNDEDPLPLVRSGVMSVELTLAVPNDLRAEYERAEGMRCVPVFARSARAELLMEGQADALAVQEASGPSPTFALQAALDRAGALEVLRALDGTAGSLVVHTIVHFHVIEEPTTETRGAATVQRSATAQRSFEARVALSDLLGGLLAGFDRERFIRMVAPGDPTSSSGIVRHVRSAKSVPTDGRVRLSALDDGVTSLARSMRPAPVAVATAAIVTSDLARPTLAYAANGRLIHHWELDDLVVDDAGVALASLPVVDDPSAAVWHDRVKPANMWYAPSFELVMPHGSDTIAQSPFVFRYWRVGASSAGAPVLRASVRFTLRQAMSPATRDAIKRLGAASVQPVPVGNLSVSLVVPYVDASDGSAKTTTLVAVATRDGDILRATVDLLDPVVRCSYGALAVPGFQGVPPRIAIAYTYEGYVPVQPGKLHVVAGGKLSMLPLVHGGIRGMGASSETPYFDASSATFHGPGGEVRFAREAPVGRGERRPPAMVAAHVAQPVVATPTPVVHATATATAIATATAQPLALSPAYVAHAVISRPPVSLAAALADTVRKTQYSRRTLAREERSDAVFPCSGFGGFYCEGMDEATARAVGCVDALRLGQASLRLYDEMPSLATSSYRVYRALQQPGQFLVLPSAYRITRFGPGVPAKAYRPAICMYSAIDAGNPANNRVVYYATLEPDVPPHERRALELRLRSEAPNPVVSYPTELAAPATYDWTVGSQLKVEPEVVRAADHFQVSLATDVPSALLLRSMLETTGVFGSAHFALSDGTTFSTALALELTHIVGPSASGPVEVVVDGNAVRLTNRIERALDVSDLMLVRAGATALETVAVDARLEAAATRAVSIGPGAIEGFAASADPAELPVSLEEIRSFVEDVHTNVIFIDLVNHANHDLRALAIQARLKDVPGTSDVTMSGDPPRGTVEFLLPLSTYLAHTVLQFSVRKSFTAAPDQTTPWLEWDLERDGNVVSLSWELIG